MEIIRGSRFVGHLVVFSAVLLMAAGLFETAAHAGPQYQIDCTSCHRMPPLDSASGTNDPYTGAVKGNHQTHTGSTPAACAKCHGDGVLQYGTSHRNKTIEIQPNINNSASNLGKYSRGFSNQTSLPPNPLGSCSNVNCHFEQTTPTWGQSFSGSGDCGSCHGFPPRTGRHPGTGSRHEDYYGSGRPSCPICHPGRSTFSHATSAGHPGQGVAVLFNSPVAGGSYTGDTSMFLPSQAPGKAPGTCVNLYCHSNGKGVFASPNWGNAASGACGTCHATDAIGTSAHQPHLTAAYGPNLGSQGVPNSCRNCHSYDPANLAATHVDGTVQAPGAGCTASCHRNAFPTWSGGRVSCESCHTGTLSVLNGIAAPTKPNFTSTGHGQAAANYAASRQCSSCHDQNSAHISNKLGTYTRIAVNDNSLCASCHNDPTKVPTASKQNLPSHVSVRGGDPSVFCKLCHDVHGTSNLASIKTKIVFGNLTGSISYTDSVNGFVQNVPPYKGLCQVCHTQTSHYLAGKPETTHNQTANCLNCHRHNDSYAFRPHGGVMTNSIYLMDASGNYLTTTDTGSDGKYHALPAYSVANTCGPCHQEIIGNEKLNYHSDLGVRSLAGRNSDPARPWAQGTGTVGKSCTGVNRQLADLKATYASEADFLAKVDLGVYDFVRKCSTCHVGGGIAVNNPYGFTNWRNPDGTPGAFHTRLDDPGRAASLALDASEGNHSRVPLNAWDFYVENGAVKRADWTRNGVLEQDCMVCHLSGYNLLARNEQIARYGNFAKAASAGATFATSNPALSGTNSFDYSTDWVKKDASNRLYLGGYLAANSITPYPADANCAACHMPSTLSTTPSGFLAVAAVPSPDPGNPDPLVAANLTPARMREDYLTRGETTSFGHYSQCSLCHTSQGDTPYMYQAWDPIGNRGGDAKAYQHGPGAGADPNIASGAKRYTVKSCEECHAYMNYENSDGSTFGISTAGAPWAYTDHDNAGLSALIVPTAMRIKDGTGAVETFMGSHIDILSCVACHITKRATAARSYDFSTGAEAATLVGNPTDQTGANAVPLAYTWKDNSDLKVLDNGQPNPRWRRQIFPFNYVTGISWNNIGLADANGDGFTAGQSNGGVPVSADPFFSRTIKGFFNYGAVNANNDAVASGLKNDPVFASRSAWAVADQGGGVRFTKAAEIDAFKSAMAAANPGYRPQLSLAAQPYLISHGTGPTASYPSLGHSYIDVNGARVYGCTDCHNSADGVFNGVYDLLGTGKRVSDGSDVPLALAWNDPLDVKAQAQAWDRNLNGLLVDFTDPVAKSTRTPGKGELLGYDTTRVAALNAVTTAGSGIGINPIATIIPPTAYDVMSWVGGIQALINTPLPFAAADAQTYLGVPVGHVTYKWVVDNDSAAVIVYQPNLRDVNITFTSTGSKTIDLTVTDEERKVARTTMGIQIIVPPMTVTPTSATHSVSTGFTFGNLPANTVTLNVSWGDGGNSFFTSSLTSPKFHTYTITGTRTMQFYAYDANGHSLASWQAAITVN